MKPSRKQKDTGEVQIKAILRVTFSPLANHFFDRIGDFNIRNNPDHGISRLRSMTVGLFCQFWLDVILGFHSTKLN